MCLDFLKFVWFLLWEYKEFQADVLFFKFNFPKGNTFCLVPGVITSNERDLRPLNRSSERCAVFLSNVSGPLSLPQFHFHRPSSCSIRSDLDNCNHRYWQPCSVPSLLPSVPLVCTNPSDFSKNKHMIILFSFHIQKIYEGFLLHLK